MIRSNFYLTLSSALKTQTICPEKDDNSFFQYIQQNLAGDGSVIKSFLSQNRPLLNSIGIVFLEYLRSISFSPKSGKSVLRPSHKIIHEALFAKSSCIYVFHSDMLILILLKFCIRRDDNRDNTEPFLSLIICKHLCKLSHLCFRKFYFFKHIYLLENLLNQRFEVFSSYGTCFRHKFHCTPAMHHVLSDMHIQFDSELFTSVSRPRWRQLRLPVSSNSFMRFLWR